MAKKKLNEINTKTKPKTFVCAKCASTYSGDQFYASSAFPSGLLPICKECLYAFTINAMGISRQGLIDASKFMNLPYIENYFQEVIGSKMSDKWKVSQYFNKLRINKEVADLHFKDSIFDYIEDLDKEEETEVVDLSEEFTSNEIENDEERITKERKTKKKRLEELRAKWGKYDSLDYLERCEELYQEIVQGGYIIRSSMHDISIRNYCKLQVKWDVAQERDDYATMSEIRQSLKDARSDAKLNPSQLKAEDFSTGGANSFSEIARVVAKRDGFIPFPMKYFKHPNDPLDFLVWELVNYMRHVLGLEEVSYEEIYEFQIKKIREFNEKYNADIENGDLGTLDERTRGKKKEWTII